MNRSDHTPISEELLSAYIDSAVTNQERATVEAAISADPALAWEVESLRRTVELIQALPPIALPRSFALREDQVADVLAERRAKSIAPAAAPAVARTLRSPVAPPRQNFWQTFLTFFNSGNLLLRNATAVAAVLFVVVLITSPGATQPGSPAPISAPATVALQAELSEPPASEAEPALAVAEESEPHNEKAAPALAPAAAVAMAETVPAPGVMDAAPAGMETGASAARAMPEGRDASAFKIMPEARGGGGLESDPALFQAAPADLAPMGRESALGDIPAEGELRQPANGENESAPVAEPAAIAVAEVPAKTAADVSADAPAAEESSPAVAVKSAPAAVSDESVARESQASPASLESDSTPVPAAPGLPRAGWGWLQAAVGGLFVLLGALWLYTRRG